VIAVVGFGAHGRGVSRALLARGFDVIAADDNESPAVAAAAAEIGVTLHAAPSNDELRTLLDGAEGFVPTPGIPEAHPVFEIAAGLGVPVMSEFDLAQRWDDRPMVAVTGTDGKTTVTAMIADIFTAAGSHTIVAGNTEPPLVNAIDDPTYDVFVVEASSFRLAHSSSFRPGVAAWLNFGPDHLDVHRTMKTYELAKASIWARHAGDDIAVANLDDPVVMTHAPLTNCRTFGLDAGDYCVRDGELTVDGDAFLSVSDLARSLPHDCANALAAAAVAQGAGVALDSIRQGLRNFRGLPHRVELVGEANDVRWYNDSKATTPHAVAAGVGGFDSVVLIAGGRNKGLDLSSMGNTGGRVHTVVAIGDAQDLIADVFAGQAHIVRANDMATAVELAGTAARPGDAVVLSPGCTSYDWYSSYGERGTHFTQLVHDLVGAPPVEAVGERT